MFGADLEGILYDPPKTDRERPINRARNMAGTVKQTKRKPSGAAAMGAGPGRPKGSQNKFSQDLKAAILNAFTTLGGEDYLVVVAKDQPAVFCALLGKVLPMQIEGTGEDGSISIRWLPPA